MCSTPGRFYDAQLFIFTNHETASSTTMNVIYDPNAVNFDQRIKKPQNVNLRSNAVNFDQRLKAAARSNAGARTRLFDESAICYEHVVAC